MQYARTAVLLAVMTALFLGAGYLIGGTSGAAIALAVAVGGNAFAYWNSDKMVLRAYGAREVSRSQSPHLYGIVEQLARRADMPMPRVYIIDSAQPNAFATGRSPHHAAVAATRGLLDALTQEEIAGVMAHELAHVKNRDTLVMTITAVLAGAISMLANFAMFFSMTRGRDDGSRSLGVAGSLLMMIVAPVAAMLVQMSVSRAREYEADKRGAALCGRPLWLASALDKLHHASRRVDNSVAERNPATAHLFIVNPLRKGDHDSLFATHPSMENRIRALRAMEAYRRDTNLPGPWGRL